MPPDVYLCARPCLITHSEFSPHKKCLPSAYDSLAWRQVNWNDFRLRFFMTRNLVSDLRSVSIPLQMW